MRTKKTGKLIGVAALIIEKGRVLCGVRNSDPFKGMACIPGGRLENGEDSITALVREVKEETGYIVEVSDSTPIVSDEIFYKGIPMTYKIYEAHIIDGKEHAQKEEVEKIVWLSPQETVDSLHAFSFPAKTTAALSLYFSQRNLA